LHNLLHNNASWNVLYVERGLLHFNIKIVHSKVIYKHYWAYRGPGPEASASPASWMIRPWLYSPLSDTAASDAFTVHIALYYWCNVD